MKTFLVFLTVLSVGLVCVSSSFAQEKEATKPENMMLTKLKRGGINVVTSPLEIPKQIKKYYNEGKEKGQKNVVWIFVGTVKGVANTVGRLGSGFWDVLTFNVEIPADYEPLMKPDYVNNK